MKRKSVTLLMLMIALVPLGLVSEYDAWGEWDGAYYEKLLGFLPEGMKNAPQIKPLLPDYAVAGLNETLSYYLSALAGSAMIVVCLYLLAKVLRKKGRHASL